MDTSKPFDPKIAYLIYLYEKELEFAHHNDLYASAAISDARLEFMEIFGFKKHIE